MANDPEKVKDLESCTEAKQEGSSQDKDSSDIVEEDWLDIFGNGQLRKKVLKAGKGEHTNPKPSCPVTVKVKGTLESGTEVDECEALHFIVGENEVIQALDVGVTLMSEEEHALIESAPRFAYGDKGRYPDIPAEAKITYEVILTSVNEPVNLATISEEDIIDIIDRKSDRGKWHFERQDFNQAISCYQRGGEMLESYIQQLQKDLLVISDRVNNGLSKCWNNVAASLMKLDLTDDAERALHKVLKATPSNVKALFRMGKVQIKKGEIKKAISYLQQAAEIDPDSKTIQDNLVWAEKHLLKSKNKEKAVYRRMVQGLAREKYEIQGKSPPSTYGIWPYIATAVAISVVGIGLAYLLSGKH